MGGVRCSAACSLAGKRCTEGRYREILWSRLELKWRHAVRQMHLQTLPLADVRMNKHFELLPVRPTQHQSGRARYFPP